VVQAAIAAVPLAALTARLEVGAPFDLPCEGGAVTLEPADFVVEYRGPEGWAGVADRGTQAAVCTHITEALAQEGMAREVVRHVQELRKKSGLEVEDRIALYLATESEPLRQAIAAHREYIAGETLARQWATEPPGGQGKTTKVKVEGKELTIELARVA
jgi:isoleucyl-tRNA synthetase